MLKTFRQPWKSQWVWISHYDLQSVCRCLFRRCFSLNEPHSLRLRVSADSRYRVYLDGRLLGTGPTAGNLFHYYYETYGGHEDSEHTIVLQPGPHVLAIEVLSYTNHGPVNEVHARGGLMVDGGLVRLATGSFGESCDVCISTPNNWKVVKDHGFEPAYGGGFYPDPDSTGNPYPYYWALGFTEKIDRRKTPVGWSQLDYDDTYWSEAIPIGQAVKHEDYPCTWDVPWVLEPSPIPLAEHTPANFERIISVTVLTSPQPVSSNCFSRAAWQALIECDAALTVPPQSQAIVVLDCGQLTTGFPEIGMQGGRDARIRLVYAEAFSLNYQKQVRDDSAYGRIEGHSDTLIVSGHKDVYSPQTWRTYRFIELHIQTQDHPLVIDRMTQTFHAYPLRQQAEFEADHFLAQSFWEKSWRTLRLCAQDHFTDCPYYEQLQYAGDTLIQALMAYNIGGDHLLWRRALQDFNYSRLPMGLTQSRYPSRHVQIIPPFSLAWICMARDYYWHLGDPNFIASFRDGMKQVLYWFQSQCDTKGDFLGLYRPRIYWNFIDWVQEWPAGDPSLRSRSKADEAVPSLPVNLQLLQAIQAMLDMADACQLDENDQDTLSQWADQITSVIRRTAWDENLQLFADEPIVSHASWATRHFSEHANILAILTGVATPAQSIAIEQSLHNPQTQDEISPCSLYFQHYYAQAMTRLGRVDRIWQRLESQWQFIEDNHLTTMPERPDSFGKTRSDCHAWSGWPAYWFISGVLGIQPNAPGYAQIKLSPQLGSLPYARGMAPSPHGPIQVNAFVSDGHWRIHAETPPGVPCTLHPPSGRTVYHNGGKLIYEESILRPKSTVLVGRE